MSFSEQLKKARAKLGYTQQCVAEQLGITKSTYCGYETGKRQPDVEKIKQLSSVLSVSGDVLLETGLGDDAYTSAIDNTEESPALAEAEAEDSVRKRLITNYDDMNDEGRERLAEISDDMIAGGRYKKPNQSYVGKEA